MPGIIVQSHTALRIRIASLPLAIALAAGVIAATAPAARAQESRRPTMRREFAPNVVVPGEAPLPRAAIVGKNAAPSDADDANAAQDVVVSQPTVSIFATTFDDPPPHPAATVDVASFNGVQPGETTAQQLVEKWGAGKELPSDGDAVVMGYSLETFPRIEVTLADGKVGSIVVHLDRPVPPEALARQLQLDSVRPVNVPDDSGDLLGWAYPERGVLFGVTADGKRVSHVVMDRVDLTPFVLRAESELGTHTRRSLADLDFVLSRDPRYPRALWLRSKLLAHSARYDEALASVDAALAEEPTQGIYRLTRGRILGLQGRYEDAARETKDVLGTASISEELKAEALCQLGDLLAASPAHDYKLAMEHHVSAIKVADPLSVDKRISVRRAAKYLLVEAHLAVAHDIASGFWQQKDRATAKWLERANAYAADLIANEGAPAELRLRVARGALAACAGAQGKIDSAPWARMALKEGKTLVAAADDPWTKLRLQWELGVALSDGLMSDDFRGMAQHALPNTALTITYLETGAQGRRETADDAYRLGWIYFRLGSLHATRRNDHKTAVTWFEKAYPLLDRPIPTERSADQGRYGQWLVSMGISYWEVGMRDFALQLTDAGMKHVQEAVNRKLIDEKVLAVPYSNLASMHRTLGHASEAQTYAQLASKYESQPNARP